jgi:hypothetical protein
MRIHIPTRALFAALLAVSALALAACGADGSGSGDSAATREQKNRDAELAFAKCMREHGIDVPDPKPNQGGIGINVPKGTSPGKVDAADNACRKYLEAVQGPDLSPEQEKKFQQAALAQARCMREHGIDMPDPTFDDKGRARIKMKDTSGGKGGGKGNGPRGGDPKVEKAMEACRKEVPGGPGLKGSLNSEEGP